jgi:hypothetical protein
MRASASTPAAQVAPVVTVVPRLRDVQRTAPARPSTTERVTARHRNHTLAQLSRLTFGLRDIATLDELSPTAGSGGSALLLAAGFLLVLFVIGETAFLGLAGSRLQVARARPPARRRSPEEPYPIRRIQLRR